MRWVCKKLLYESSKDHPNILVDLSLEKIYTNKKSSWKQTSTICQFNATIYINCCCNFKHFVCKAFPRWYHMAYEQFTLWVDVCMCVNKAISAELNCVATYIRAWFSATSVHTHECVCVSVLMLRIF